MRSCTRSLGSMPIRGRMLSCCRSMNRARSRHSTVPIPDAAHERRTDTAPWLTVCASIPACTDAVSFGVMFRLVTEVGCILGGVGPSLAIGLVSCKSGVGLDPGGPLWRRQVAAWGTPDTIPPLPHGDSRPFPWRRPSERKPARPPRRRLLADTGRSVLV